MHTILFEKVDGDDYWLRARWTGASGIQITVSYIHVDEFSDVFGNEAYGEIKKHGEVTLEINVKEA